MTVSQLPPQEPEKVAPEVSGLMAEKEKQALEAPSPASSEAPEETIPTHMQPLHLQLGVLKGCTSARLKVAQRDHQLHMPQSAHMCVTCSSSVFISLIIVITFINETQVFMYDNSNYINNPHIFTSMYIQRVLSKKPSLPRGLPIYIYHCHMTISLISLVISLWEQV